MGLRPLDTPEIQKKKFNINEGPPKPRCLATLPNNIEELVLQFKMQEQKHVQPQERTREEVRDTTR